MQKFLIPIKPNNFISRVQLLAKINKSVSKHSQMAFVKAPGGYGKTYLMTDFADEIIQSGGKVVWFTCSVDDNTAEYFFVSLLNELKKQAIIAENIFYDENISFLRFINRLFEQLDTFNEELYFLFDDVHCINNSIVIDFLQQLSLHSPRNIKAILASRFDPPFNIAKALLANTVIKVNQDDLSFSSDEVKEISKQSSLNNLTENEIDLVLERTGGWPAIVSTSVSVDDWRVKSPNWDDEFSNANVNLAEYFYQEILASLSSEEKDDLISLTISEYLCNDLIEALILKKDFFAKISDVIPLIRLNDPLLTKSLQWFSIHPLMREYLKSQLMESKTIDLIALEERAAKWFLGQKVYIEATEHYVKAKLYDEAVNLITNYGIDILSSGNFPRFKSLIKQFPYDVVMSNPYVLVLVGWSYALSYQHKNAKNVIDMMEKMVQKNPQLNTSFNSLIIALKCAIGLFSDHLLEHEADVRSELENSPLNIPYAENSLRAELSLICLHTNDFETLRSLVNEGHFFTEGGSLFYSTLIIRFTEAMMEFSLANFDKCIAVCDDIDKFISTKAHDSQLHFIVHTIRGMSAYVTGDLESASKNFAKSDNIISYISDPTILIWYYPLKLQMLTDLGEQEQKEVCIEQFMELMKSRNLTLTKTPLVYEVIEHNLELGNRDDALGLYQTFKEEVNVQQSSHLLFNEALIDALVLTDKAEFTQVKEILHCQIKHFEDNGRIVQQVRALIFLVNTYIKTEEVSLAKVTLKKAIAIASSKQLIQFFARLSSVAIGYLQDWSATELSPLRKEFLVSICERFDGKDSDQTFNAHSFEQLTVKEKNVMELLGQGYSNQQIADELFLSINTVKSHLKVAYKKLGVSNRIQAVKLFTKINFSG